MKEESRLIALCSFAVDLYMHPLPAVGTQIENCVRGAISRVL